MNTSLLKDRAYLDQTRKLIEICKQKYRDLDDKRLLWDVMKCEIRADTISYSCYKAKVQRETETNLSDRLKLLEERLSEDPSPDIEEEYSLIKSELDSILSCKTRGAILRSKAKWAEEGEKNTSYFLKLEKRNQKKKCITSLCVNSSTITKGPEILEAEKDL